MVDPELNMNARFGVDPHAATPSRVPGLFGGVCKYDLAAGFLQPGDIVDQGLRGTIEQILRL